MPELQEQGVILTEGARAGRLNVQIITPGWGSSGYYSADVLEQASRDGIFHAGTHMYLDHPTVDEQETRPNRSVKDLAAVLTEDAKWTGSALVAQVRTFGPYRDAVAEMADAIGVSIRADAEVAEGEAEGKRGVVVEKLTNGRSIDFVTAAGRGGRILQVLESAREAVNASAVSHGVEEATVNDTRELLDRTLSEKFGGKDTHIWVRDFDDSTVWYEKSSRDGSYATFQAGYTATETTAQIKGDPVKVRARTSYVPLNEEAVTENQPGDPASSEDPPESSTPPDENSTDASSSGDGADGTTPDPAVVADPTAGTAENPPIQEEQMPEEVSGSGGSAPPTASSRQVLEQQIAEARRVNQLLEARDKARPIIAEDLGMAVLTPLVVQRLSEELSESLPMVNGELDVVTLRDRIKVKRDRAELELGEALSQHGNLGLGQPRGLGASVAVGQGGRAAEFDTITEQAMVGAFGLSEKAAHAAVEGR